MQKTILALLIYTAVSEWAAASQFQSAEKELVFCAPVQQIDWNPYREIKDGKDLAYLLTFTVPLISSDPATTPGVLESYEFPPRLKTFKGRVRSDLKWNDGTKVTAQQVADSLIKNLKYRPIGKRIKATHFQENSPTDFEIHFETDVQNFEGALREALSSGSRHNRVWIAKDPKGPYLLKYPYRLASNGELILNTHHTSTRVTRSPGKCRNADFTLHPDGLSLKPDQYHIQFAERSSAAILQLNSARLELNERKLLASWVHRSIATAMPQPGLESIDRLYRRGEPGFTENSPWAFADDLEKIKSRRWKIAVETPVFAELLRAEAGRTRVPLEILPFPLEGREVDAQLLSSGVIGGRLVILQDILQWSGVSEMLTKTPETRRLLFEIAAQSASTTPPGAETLAQFEKAASAEWSLVPLARRRAPLFASKRSGLGMSFVRSGDIELSPMPK